MRYHMAAEDKEYQQELSRVGGERIYVNRSLRMDKIKCIGFDMDATLAIYKSPQAEELAFNLSLIRLVDIGYPEEIVTRPYRSDFVARNAWFDKKLGNLLKTDEHCNILTAFHGFTKLEKKEIRQEYPNKHVTLEESRIFVLNTVFNVPEALLLATLVDYFENHSTSFEKLPNKTGYKKKDAQQQILYSTIFEDCRQTIEWIHVHGDFRKIVSENLKHYIQLDDRAVSMMKMLSQSGKKLFLLTNSPWLYTKKMMSYVMGPEWQELFDVVIADGNKPRWFLQDTPFKEVNKSTGTNLIGTYWGPFRKGDVYTAGCAALFIQQMRLAGKDILYVGDHIFGDVLKSKKTGGWRTLLIVPELDRELKVWVDQNRKFDRLLDLNSSLSRSDSADGAVKKETLKEIARLTDEMEQRYSAMGSIMRSGWRLTHFASQLRRYADMYTCNVYNLADYSPSFYFNSPIYLLPHEEKFMPSAEQVEDTDAAPEEEERVEQRTQSAES